MDTEGDARTASGLALVDYRLGLIDTSLDVLSKTVSRLPTVETLNLILTPYGQRIEDMQEDIKDIRSDVETLQKLEPTVVQLKQSEESRASISRQLKLVIAGAIISPIVAVIISALTVFFTVNGGVS